MLQIIETPFGRLGARWTAKGLFACEFLREGWPADLEDSCVDSSRRLDALDLSHALESYFRSGQLSWKLDRLDWSGVTDFHKEVLEYCYAIPAGQTLSYGQLAARVGKPRAARAVGSAMSKNRWPILIPCHRVVGATGKLTGYSGNGGLATKQELLNLETNRGLEACGLPGCFD